MGMKDGIIEPNPEPVTEEQANLSGILSGDSGEQANNIIADLNNKPAFMQEGLKEADKQAPEVKVETSIISPVEIGEDGCTMIISTIYSICRMALRVTKEEYQFDENTIKQRGEVLYQCLQLYGVRTDIAKIILPVTLIAGIGVDLMECKQYATAKREAQQGTQKPATEAKP